MSYKINKISLEDEFKICPLCSYKDGFHTMLKKDKDSIKKLFICPACHQVFDINFN